MRYCMYLLYLPLLLGASCSTGLKNVCIEANTNHASQGWEIIPKIGYFGDYPGGDEYLSNEKTSITFHDSKYLLKEKIKKLDLNMAPESAYKEAHNTDHKLCEIIVWIERYSIGAANTDNFTYIVKYQGKEIYRRNGYNNIANVPIGRYSGWTNSSIVYFNEPDGSFEFYVIDNLINKRFQFTITPTQ